MQTLTNDTRAYLSFANPSVLDSGNF